MSTPESGLPQVFPNGMKNPVASQRVSNIKVTAIARPEEAILRRNMDSQFLFMIKYNFFIYSQGE